MSDLIRREDAIKALYKYSFVSKDVIKREILAVPSVPQKAIAEVTFDEEKLREIVKEAVERFKEEYEIIDRPQGWVDKAISIIDDMQKEGIIDFEQAWEFRMRARIKGADDE